MRQTWADPDFFWAEICLNFCQTETKLKLTGPLKKLFFEAVEALADNVSYVCIKYNLMEFLVQVSLMVSCFPFFSGP